MSKRKHTMRASIVKRDPNVWLVSCGQHANWAGDTYEEVEDEWRKHVYEETGKVVWAGGNKVGRWQP